MNFSGMTKEEQKDCLYNFAVWTVKKGGQGVIKELIPKQYIYIFDELVNEGVLKYVKMPFKYTPDDTRICLTKGYCLEDELLKEIEEGDDERNSLTHIRYYLGEEKLFGLLFSKENHRKAFENNEKCMEKYNKWLLENKDVLEELMAIQYNDKYEQFFNGK